MKRKHWQNISKWSQGSPADIKVFIASSRKAPSFKPLTVHAIAGNKFFLTLIRFLLSLGMLSEELVATKSCLHWDNEGKTWHWSLNKCLGHYLTVLLPTKCAKCCHYSHCGKSQVKTLLIMNFLWIFSHLVKDEAGQRMTRTIQKLMLELNRNVVLRLIWLVLRDSRDHSCGKYFNTQY